LKIALVTPAARHSLQGNRITALRWARLLRSLGHELDLIESYEDGLYDLLIALHARKSHSSMVQFRRRLPEAPIVLCMTGTDLYGDIQTDENAKESLEMAARIVVLHGKGAEALPPRLRGKARVILQSAIPSGRIARPSPSERFDVCVMGHIREVKDPFRAAEAAGLLPPDSRIRIIHIGGILDEGMGARARTEAATNPRYEWLGELPQWKALDRMSRCRLHVLSSKSEGGANVLSEAIACSVPTLSSRIPGSIGLLGEDYPGYFPVGDTRALAELMYRAETQPAFYGNLREWCERLKPLFEPAKEENHWEKLLRELFPE
jgi:putative glycosyltransferase (TIGR04348 family)